MSSVWSIPDAYILVPFLWIVLERPWIFAHEVIYSLLHSLIRYNDVRVDNVPSDWTLEVLVFFVFTVFRCVSLLFFLITEIMLNGSALERLTSFDEDGFSHDTARYVTLKLSRNLQVKLFKLTFPDRLESGLCCFANRVDGIEQ